MNGVTYLCLIFLLQAGPTHSLECKASNASKYYLSNDVRSDPLHILSVRNLRKCKTSHKGTGGGDDGIAETGAELVSHNSYLTGDAGDICQRDHQGHYSCSLTGTGGDEEVNDVVEDEHQYSANARTCLSDRDTCIVNDGVDDVALIEDERKTATEGGNKASAHHGLTAIDKALNKLIHGELVNNSDVDAKEKEYSGEVGHAPVPLEGSKDNYENSYDKAAERCPLGGGNISFFAFKYFEAHEFRDISAFGPVQAVLGILVDLLSVHHAQSVGEEQVADVEEYTNRCTGEDRQISHTLCYRNSKYVGCTNVKACVSAEVDKDKCHSLIHSQSAGEKNANRHKSNGGVSNRTGRTCKAKECHEYKDNHRGGSAGHSCQLAKNGAQALGLIKHVDSSTGKEQHERNTCVLGEAVNDALHKRPEANAGLLDGMISACDILGLSVYNFGVINTCGNDPGHDSKNHSHDHHKNYGMRY